MGAETPIDILVLPSLRRQIEEVIREHGYERLVDMADGRVGSLEKGITYSA